MLAVVVLNAPDAYVGKVMGSVPSPVPPKGT
jgi:hypothetical protein